MDENRLIFPTDSSFGPSEKKNIEQYLRGKQIYFSGIYTELKKKNFFSSSKQQQEEQKILIVSSFRFHVFSTSSSSKPLFDAHILDLLDYQITTEGSSEQEATLKFNQITINFNNSEKVQELSIAIKKMFSLNFPGMQESKNGNTTTTTTSNNNNNLNIGACGGFSRTYRCCSDFYGIQVREDICWEVDNLFESNNIKDLNLSDWPESPTPQQGRAMIDALKYNQWFESVTVANSTPSTQCKIGNDGVHSVNRVLETNRKISRLQLSNINARESWITPETWMSLAFNNYLTQVDLSNNSIEDRGVQFLCNDWLSTISHEIHSINLSKCNIGKQGLSNLFRAFRQNKWISKNLKFLSVSGNRMEDAASDMVLFLSEATALRQFEMSNCQPTWSAIKPPPTIQKSKETRIISKLDLSANKLNFNASNKQQLEQNANDLSLFLSMICPNLADIDLSSTCPSPNSIYTILSSVINLIRLNLSDNELEEEGIVTLVDILCHTTLPKLKHLYINRNFTINTDIMNKLSISKVTSKLTGDSSGGSGGSGGGVGSGSLGNAVKSLVKLISPSSFSLCPLETLHFAGQNNGRVKGDIIPLAHALLKNDTITEIDISGHHAGDDLAITLGRVIQVNKTIKTLYWDENLTTTVGLEYFSIGFKRNQSIQHMPMLVLDIADFLKQPENSPSMQMIKERLRLVDTTTTVQQRVTQLASDIQSQIINNNLRKMKDAINKAVTRKRNEAAISNTMNSPKSITSTKPPQQQQPPQSINLQQQQQQQQQPKNEEQQQQQQDSSQQPQQIDSPVQTSTQSPQNDDFVEESLN
ncbi:hypothetical protein DDB_G0286681 [Dictyostelium discoideum AX4]|uniref:Leucine-rich repeat-containing protein n=1 Tax=Dictyostelium discoideum TaxID=44689 RepID=Q54LE3_DICDI|nr:hypothetical protein DDB_G0286681 [Dictyostelium discoideum AX4]EAL64096.1 hypothetical protein DDB_G0286681 [Dictyostelium discoideum AX4]|eukprot:XP_637618.1 hypothetical protein DDB_G0286681 [Dictyostelium discoideum AX4]